MALFCTVHDLIQLQTIVIYVTLMDIHYTVQPSTAIAAFKGRIQLFLILEMQERTLREEISSFRMH